MPEFAAFLSYARLDDQYERGAPSNFRERLEQRVRQRTGRTDFQIFQDTKDIQWGDRWRQKIRQAVAEDAYFLIPVLTPLYFNSEKCRSEYKLFLTREKKLGRNDLVLPWYWLDTDWLENEQQREMNPWAKDIARRQWRDLRFIFREASLDTPRIRQTIDDLARSIKERLAQVISSKLSQPATSDLKVRLRLAVAQSLRLPILTMVPSFGVPGTVIKMFATGLTPDGTIQIGGITIGGGAWNVAPIALDRFGTFHETEFQVPAGQAPGTYRVNVIDSSSRSAYTVLTVPQRTIYISPSGSPRGSPITVTGAGFTRRSPITITYGSLFAAQATSDDNGSFVAAFTVPSVPKGRYLVLAIDDSAPGRPTNSNTVVHQVTEPFKLP